LNKSTLALLSLLSACSSTPTRTDTFAETDAGGLTGGAQTGGESTTGGGMTGGQSSGGTTGGTGDPNALGCNKMDILFVIDNSGSMSEEQTNLAENFPKFIEVLNAFQGGSLDYRVGVTTTSFPTELFGIMVGTGEEGALLKTDSMTKAWLERTDPDVAQTFTKLATVGVDGSGQEQQLRAARAAITERVTDGSNKDFLREDALLAVVILTDEDDGSSEATMGGGFPFPGSETPVADFVTAFDMAKGDRARWATAVIAGDQQPSCMSQFGSANHAARLLEFVKQTGKNAVFSSICNGDLSMSLEDALETFSVACDNFVVI